MKAIKHIKTTLKHRHTVMRHCAKCGILWQGLRHDLSKYSPTELLPSIKYYQGDRSPNEAERRDKGYSEAWMHHKGRNRHHFEYWTDYNPYTRLTEPVKMPLRYVAEMFCDRVAASKIYRGDKYTNSDPLEYFMNSKSIRVIHPETSDFLEKLLRMLEEKGERETFGYLKDYIKNNKDY